MRRCEDEKMIDRPPLLEEPFAQTLSGKIVIDKHNGCGACVAQLAVTCCSPPLFLSLHHGCDGMSAEKRFNADTKKRATAMFHRPTGSCFFSEATGSITTKHERTHHAFKKPCSSLPRGNKRSHRQLAIVFLCFQTETSTKSDACGSGRHTDSIVPPPADSHATFREPTCSASLSKTNNVFV